MNLNQLFSEMHLQDFSVLEYESYKRNVLWGGLEERVVLAETEGKRKERLCLAMNLGKSGWP